MKTEIEVEGVGTIRPLNHWQASLLKKARRSRHPDLRYAMAAGMTISQWKTLEHAQQDAVRQAVFDLASPANVTPREG